MWKFLLLVFVPLAVGRLIPLDASLKNFQDVADPVVRSSRLGAGDPFLAEKYHSGYINVDKDGGEMFYWFFPLRHQPSTSETPFIIWLTGGPGCSSELAALTENGPLNVHDDGSVERNPTSWTEVADTVFIDQPLGTGFSAAGNPRNYVTNEEKIAADLREFLIKFIDLYPMVKNRPFFITGESYAGHYIPSIAHLLIKSPIDELPLKGIAIGNGWVDPESQYPSYALFGFEHGLIDQLQFQAAKKGFEACVQLIQKGLWPVAVVECNAVVSGIIKGKNPYDVRLDCEDSNLCYNMTGLTDFLNRRDVQSKLGVHRPWKECNPLVYALLLGDWITEMRSKVADLLESGVQVLIYSGDQDFICNWRGGQAWVEKIEWSKKDEFQDVRFKPWKVDGKEAGEVRQVDNLTFLRIYDAGHMVPMDQGAAALAMVKEFFGGKVEQSNPYDFIRDYASSAIMAIA